METVKEIAELVLHKGWVETEAILGEWGEKIKNKAYKKGLTDACNLIEKYIKSVKPVNLKNK